MKSPNLQKKFLLGNALSPALSIFLYSPEGEREGTGLRRWPVHVRGFLEVGSYFRLCGFQACVSERIVPGSLGAESPWDCEVACSAQGPAPGGDLPSEPGGTDTSV